MRAASRSGCLALVVGLGLFAFACGGTAETADGSEVASPASTTAPAPTSVGPSPSPLPSAAADANAADPVIAFRGLDAARRALFADPDSDPVVIAAIWEPGSEAYELAAAEIGALASTGVAVDETGFALVSIHVIAVDDQVAMLRTVLGPGHGSVPGTDRSWSAEVDVTIDVTLVKGTDGRWRIANDVEIGAIP